MKRSITIDKQNKEEESLYSLDEIEANSEDTEINEKDEASQDAQKNKSTKKLIITRIIAFIFSIGIAIIPGIEWPVTLAFIGIIFWTIDEVFGVKEFNKFLNNIIELWDKIRSK